MRKVLLGFGLITVIGLICGLLWANPGSDTWSATTDTEFNQGTLNQTAITGTGVAADVTLKSFPLTFTAVAAGAYHSLGLAADGTVWAWGRNNNGQLGDGNNPNDSWVPVQVSGITSATAVAASYFSLCLLSNGEVWGWGPGHRGELGYGGGSPQYTPVQVSGINTAVEIAVGSYHSLFRLSNGEVWSCGANFYGECGDGTSGIERLTPVQVLYIGITNTPTAISAGGSHSLCLLDDNTLRAWGRNNKGQCGDGTGTTDHDVPVQVSGITTATAVAGGGSHSICLLNDNTIQAWGTNGYSELGDGTWDSNPHPTPAQVSGVSTATAISAGSSHSLCLFSSNGTLGGWGRNSYGALDNGTTGIYRIPIQVSGITTATAVASGPLSFHSLCRLEDGTLQAWGYNNSGQQGDGTSGTNRLTPVPVSLPPGGYVSSGNYISPVISATNLCKWGILNYTKSDESTGGPVGTELTVDVLDASNNPISTNVASGTDLSSISAIDFPEIKLRALMTTTNSSNTPTLSDWSVGYTTGTLVQTSNWTDLQKGVKSVRIGNHVPVISFVIKTVSGEARWKSVRIKQLARMPPKFLTCYIYVDNGDNKWKTTDKKIAKMDFGDSNEIKIMMKRHKITTKPQRIFIVWHIHNDASGVKAALNCQIKDKDWFEFEGDAFMQGDDNYPADQKWEEE